jgi:endogenous inhibitor of DNA gyrase (YacG/DUF329 family)
MITIKCPICNKFFQIPKGHLKNSKTPRCSKKCYYKVPRIWARGKFPNRGLKGKDSPSWKGGRVLHNGYWSIKKLDHPFRDAHGYIFEHRLVMEKILNRYLQPNELVHHKGIKYPIGSIKNMQDNRPENLELTTRIIHPKDHPSQRNNKGQFI